MSIAANILEIRKRIARAARKAGRDPEDITLMAVSKTVEPARIREAYEAGIRIFGENRVQEFERKSHELQELSSAQWHLIGHLQSNKAAKAVELFGAIDSVDSLKLANKLDSAADKPIPVLIEVNIGGEDAKSGLPPDSAELEDLLTAAADFEHLQVCGLMTIPPFTDEPEGARRYFRDLRDLRAQLAGRKFSRVSLDVLSMGMSHDFEVAIEEGSTCVRVGTAIFGARQ